MTGDTMRYTNEFFPLYSKHVIIFANIGEKVHGVSFMQAFKGF
ncbi:hypothetical protein ANAPC1_01334 [Anaplasma phagocytophilum]|uniref:Uncharacterized protein n=1 Tax=Anaplasma phagocytophilum TaxID=948 RepID=A0AA45UU04_ANAPH|nr:hypothetical protein ANAPC1_01334 [Anaplasma phagocytophilum]SBO30386.1 hypothetical protein ANAPC2_00225 [Anaplasma phagocytophilum]SBO30803.1 hypothetical protein ANAPC3_00310 [Anaplasma phagocytophilum]SBO30860.1 hypothetical protein ANAPC4_00319 [Anaplasma phagocytophilum]SCV65736.1 hypothetical protein ANAPC5_01233 [Anaplasma phagocytophilum]